MAQASHSGRAEPDTNIEAPVAPGSFICDAPILRHTREHENHSTLNAATRGDELFSINPLVLQDLSNTPASAQDQTPIYSTVSNIPMSLGSLVLTPIHTPY